MVVNRLRPLVPPVPLIPPASADVDECSGRSDQDLSCDHFCHNYIGGYYCSCRYGYLLHSDKHTCRGEAGAGLCGAFKVCWRVQLS